MSEDLIKLYQSVGKPTGNTNNNNVVITAISVPNQGHTSAMPTSPVNNNASSITSPEPRYNNVVNPMLKFGSRSYSSNAVVTKVISANNSPILHNVQVKSPLSYLNLTEYLSKTTPSPLSLSERLNSALNPNQSASMPRTNSAISSALGQVQVKAERMDVLNPTEHVMKRKREKCNKGLRHFSMKVCEKVKHKGVTSYNEVADELVSEYCTYATANASASGSNSIDSWYDQKNVRRRVYDALNVLMAMNIISKEKKEIKWIGLPSNKKQECAELEAEKKLRIERIQTKCDQLKDLLLEQIAIKSLVERNVRRELVDQSLPWSKILQEHSKNQQENSQDSVVSQLKLPFIVINTDNKTVIDCSISDDKKEYVIQLDNTFQINSHIDVLKKLGLTNGLDKTAPSEAQDENYLMENDQKLKKACSMLPKIFEPYIRQMSALQKLEPVGDSIDIPNYSETIRNQNVKNINKFLKIKSMKTADNAGRNSRKKLCTNGFGKGPKAKGDNENEMGEDNDSNEYEHSMSGKTTTSKSSVNESNPNSSKVSKEFDDEMEENSFDNSNEFDEAEDEFEEDDFEDEEDPEDESGPDDDDEEECGFDDENA